MKRRCHALVICFLLLVPGFPIDAWSQVSGDQRRASFDAVVRSFQDDEQFTGVVLVADAEGVIFEGAYGVADRELGTRSRLDNVFLIGSMTKAFTAALVLQFVESGDIQLDAPVTKYWADFPDSSGGSMSIDHLLTHRSGLPHWGAVDGFLEREARLAWNPEDLTRLYVAEGLRFEPGTENAYSSIGYLALGVVLEKVSGESYADLLQSRIFGPLGMTSSCLDDAARIVAGRVPAYRYNFLQARYDNAEFRDPSTTGSTGGILTTARDLQRWAEALLGGAPEVVSPSMRERMFDETHSRQAYGWEVVVDSDGKSISHGGLVTGYRSQIAIDVTHHRMIILLNNLRDAETRVMVGALAPILDGEPGVPARRSVMKEVLRVSAREGSAAAVARFDAIIAEGGTEFDLGETQLLRAALELRSDGAYDRAAPLYERWIEEYPDSRYVAMALAGAADCRLNEGENGLARDLIDRLRETDPEHPMLSGLESRL